jgi:type II secretory pathway component GspD/PulD (secretin)
MQRSLGAILVLAAMMLCRGNPTAAQDAAAEGGETQNAAAKESSVRLLYAIRNQPAQELAAFLQTNYGDDDSVKFAAEPNANVLGIRAANQDLIDDVLKTLEIIDKPKRRIEFQFLVITAADPGEDDQSPTFDESLLTGSANEVLSTARGWIREGKAARVRAYKLSSLDNQIAETQITETVPRIVGMTVSPRGSIPTYRDEQVGVHLSLIAKVAETEEIVSEVIYNASELQKTPPVETDVETDQVGQSKVLSHRIQTTISVPNGHSVVISGEQGESKSSSAGTLFVVSAKIVEP